MTSLIVAVAFVTGAEKLTESVTFEPGAINRVTVRRGDSKLAVYAASSDDSIETILLTHHRRDVVCAARPHIQRGARAVAPAEEKKLLADAQEFWDGFKTARFHDYDQQSTKIVGEPLEIDQWVRSGDAIQWRGLSFSVVRTPGYTRGAVSYLLDVDNQRIAFTGDLIYGDGKISDLYSFQDAIPEAKIRGYHGYGSRLAGLVTSLEAVADENPDLIVPCRGPVIRQPKEAIQKLIERVRALYHNYLSTNALHWYFKEDRMRQCGERVLGKGAKIKLMPYCLHKEGPDWLFPHSTSRLLISDDGRGFLLDCGNQRVIDTIDKLIADKVVTGVDGIFVTHYHDDHTNMVQAAAEHFQCPVYATAEYTDVLENPGAFHLPAMTSNAIREIKVKKSGETMKWKEYDLTFHFFPGQTFYHGALFVRRKGETPIFFIGDAFAPSGIDDYCVLNRNLVHEDSGYLQCLKMLNGINEDFWLVNEHIPYVFKYSGPEMKYLETEYRKRIAMLKELFPWDDPNYGVDEQWAVFYPYGINVKPGESFEFQVRVTNHSPRSRTFEITPHAPKTLTLDSSAQTLTLAPRQRGKVALSVKAPAKPGNYLVTADVHSEGMHFERWVEGLATVEEK